jgi:hypothetical protein
MIGFVPGGSYRGIPEKEKSVFLLRPVSGGFYQRGYLISLIRVFPERTDLQLAKPG